MARYYYPRSRDGTMAEAKAATVMCDLMAGLVYLHMHHICHRDLKPEVSIHPSILRANHWRLSEGQMDGFTPNVFTDPSPLLSSPLPSPERAGGHARALQDCGLRRCALLRGGGGPRAAQRTGRAVPLPFARAAQQVGRHVVLLGARDVPRGLLLRVQLRHLGGRRLPLGLRPRHAALPGGLPRRPLRGHL